MKARLPLFIPLVFVSLLVFSSCLKDKADVVVKHYSDQELAVLNEVLNLPAEPLDYRVSVPAELGGFSFFVDNDKATLGRVLFYDKKLSANGKVSCASCHLPEKGFADGKALSEGFAGELTERNSLALGAVVNFESSYNGPVVSQRAGFFWDERARTVAEQSTQTLQNPIEMGADLEQLGEKLMQEEYYRILFRKAFGNRMNFVPTSELITEALQEFVNSIATFNSKFDKGLRAHGSPSVSFSNFTAEENRGKELFLQHCASCHDDKVAVQRVNIANNGLELNYKDRGVGAVTNRITDNGKFKVPMLRNVALTAPYMHDGRFATLEEVVEHYSSGIQPHPNLDERLRDENGEPKRLNLSEEDKAALVAFLHTLTDLGSLVQEKYLDPFKK
ncbi:MAG: cytochrome-c peroxidase [Bacteroidetes bacterium]|nr:MAG: cytochrome-c peroxidase [Bacteroidota bacterium]